MRISDWSSDVCSSDLDARVRQHGFLAEEQAAAGAAQFLQRIAEQQAPGLGAAMIELDVVFVRQAVAAERVQRVRDAAGRGAHAEPEQHRYRCRRFLVAEIGRASCRERGCTYG